MSAKLIIPLFFCLFYSNYQAQRQKAIFKQYTGDLNNDRIPDIISINEFRCKGDRNDDDFRKCRNAIVSLYDDKGESISWSNSKIIPCSFCSEDESEPLKEVKIKKNRFSIISVNTLLPSGMKLIKTVTFKYDKNRNNFILFKVIQETETYKNGELERKVNTETVKNFGIITFSDYF